MSLKLSVLLGVSFVLADRNVNTQVTDTRFAVVPFNLGEFPSAVNRCNPNAAIAQQGSQMATCVAGTNGKVMNWTAYDDDDCTAFAAFQTFTNDWNLSIEYNYTLSATGAGNVFDFNCDEDSNDDFTLISFTTGDCDSNVDNIFLFYAALGTCVQNTGLKTLEGVYDNAGSIEDPADYTSLLVYCDENRAELQYFDNPNVIPPQVPPGSSAVCDDNNFYEAANVTRVCGYMLSATLTGIPITVSGALEFCSLYDDINDLADIVNEAKNPSQSENGAVGLSGIFAGLIATILTLYALVNQ